MTIEELENEHFQISDEFDRCAEQHTKLSIEFAISVLEEFNPYWVGDVTMVYTTEIESKIQELKQYLDEKDLG